MRIRAGPAADPGVALEAELGGVGWGRADRAGPDGAGRGAKKFWATSGRGAGRG